MQIKILFDSKAIDKIFFTGWGLSYLIDGQYLFDTREKPGLLLKNMAQMKISPRDLKAVVISHDHWDHRGGLWDLLKVRPGLKVYSCPNFSKRFKNRVRSYDGQLIERDKFTPISKNMYISGEIKGKYALRCIPEQALVLKT